MEVLKLGLQLQRVICVKLMQALNDRWERRLDVNEVGANADMSPIVPEFPR